LRVTREEKSAISSKAAAAKVSMTQLVVDAVSKATVVVPDPEAVGLRLRIVDALAAMRELKLGAPDFEARLEKVEAVLERLAK
jgi:uncharacterized protein (DUF1778 family)